MSGPAVYVVVGAPRSGTSALAMILREQGIPMYFGADAPDDDSPSGNHEDNLVRMLNNELMGANGLGDRRDWDNPHYPEPAEPRQLRLIRAYATARLRHAGGGTWGVKDPRLCFLVEPWKRATEGLPVRWIHIRRENRDASIRSLVRMLPPRLRHTGDPDTVYRLASNWLESYHLASELGFHRAAIDPYRTTYEALLRGDGRAALARHCGFTRPITCVEPRLNRQGRPRPEDDDR